MNLTPDFCVIGGGIAALTIARLLARDGRSVVVAADRKLGSGASTAAAGMLAPLVEARLAEEPIVRFGFEALNYYPGFVAELEEESGMSVDYRQEGTLVVAIDRDHLEHLRHLYEEQRRLELPVEWLSGYECRQIEPYLATGIPGGLFSRHDHQVDNRLLMQGLVTALRRNPAATLLEDAGVGRFEGEATADLRFVLSDATISAGTYVVATGAYGNSLGTLLPEMARMIRPVKGQIIRLDQSRMPLLDHVVRSPEMYMAPKSNGQLVLGATSEDKGFDAQITAGGVFEMLRAAWECLPGIYELPIIETTVGFRPAAIDHEPLLGATDVDRVFIASGYYRHGIMFAPYSAQLLCDRLLDGVEHHWLTKFSPARFHAVST